MVPTLLACPDYLVERIVASLDLEGIRNLRLTSKAVSVKVSQGRFRLLCQSKCVDLTSEGLQTFLKSIEANGSRLKNLSLIGLARKPSPQEDKRETKRRQESKTRHLTEALNKITRRKKNGRLESLTLGLTIVYMDETQHLPIDAKIPWRYPTKRVWACAVDTWVFDVDMDFVQMEDFELHYFHTYNDRFDIDRNFHSERILQNVVELENLPKLRRSRLRGIKTTETDLLNFIKRTDPIDLALESVHLEEGGFASIIELVSML
ncbi:uncharacterized protein GIQ15_02501 [Arthroderma uncinatum]|uniref:uncharacterized protein n=1 Tax=Arthroderma uncinatum TaxID=74035 RepID=UPI00144AB5A0|nr:uncharacterized protein GIQ15_02501 [Arthroderma uncinatum]KAF3483177.1 hypothetical protein GIQ15_02501 [Arthroderma uncinatum]